MRKKDLLSFKFSGKLENKNHRSISLFVKNNFTTFNDDSEIKI